MSLVISVQGTLASLKLFLELDPIRVASIHWKNKDYFVGISVLKRLLLTTWFPLSEFSIIARKEKKPVLSSLKRERKEVSLYFKIILKVTCGIIKSRTFDIYKVGWKISPSGGLEVKFFMSHPRHSSIWFMK